MLLLRSLLLQAITAWRDGTGYSRCQLVKQYFSSVAGFTAPEVLLEVPIPEGTGGSFKDTILGLLPKQVAKSLTVLASRVGQDPFYAVLAYKGSKPS